MDWHGEKKELTVSLPRQIGAFSAFPETAGVGGGGAQIVVVFRGKVYVGTTAARRATTRKRTLPSHQFDCPYWALSRPQGFAVYFGSRSISEPAPLVEVLDRTCHVHT